MDEKKDIKKKSHSAARQKARSDHTSAVGGAWETVVDRAISEVVSFLVSTTRPFDPLAPLSQCMLLLIDHSVLRDIVVERNCNQTCGCIGCGEIPLGLQSALADQITFAWHRGGDDDTDSDDDGDAVNNNAGTSNNMVDAEEGDIKVGHEENSDLVYAEDYHADETFRLANTMQRRLARMQRRDEKQRANNRAAARTAAGAATASSSSSLLRPVVGSSGMFGALMEDRFCSAQCLDFHEGELKAQTARYFQYSHPRLIEAIANLFPNLRLEALKTLAGADAQMPLVSGIKEKGSVVGAQDEKNNNVSAIPAVVTGVSFESSGAAAVAQQALAHETVQGMTPSTRVWGSDMFAGATGTMISTAQGSSRSQQQQQHAHPAGAVKGPAAAAAAVDDEDNDDDNIGASSFLAPPARLSGSLLVMDFLLNVCSERTHQLFKLHYAANREAVRAQLTLWQTKTQSSQQDADGLLLRVVEPIIMELESEYIAMSSSSSGGVVLNSASHDLRVNPLLQQQRREIIASHLFSVDTTEALSRLLFIDPDVLAGDVWRIWHQTPPSSAGDSGQYASLSLRHSLVFPFTIPAVLLHPVTTSPEPLVLAVTLTISALCCLGSEAWTPLMECCEPLAEVLEAIGVEESDLTACVRALVLTA